MWMGRGGGWVGGGSNYRENNPNNMKDRVWDATEVQISTIEPVLHYKAYSYSYLAR